MQRGRRRERERGRDRERGREKKRGRESSSEKSYRKGVEFLLFFYVSLPLRFLCSCWD